MNKTLIIHGSNRFGNKARARGGKCAADAVAAADSNLEAMLPRILAELDVRLAELDARFGVAAPDRGGEPKRSLYDCALNVVEASGGLPGAGVDEAAKSLCELVSRNCGQLDWAAIDVHLDALRMLRLIGQSLPEAERRRVLDGLRSIGEKYGAQSAGATGDQVV